MTAVPVDEQLRVLLSPPDALDQAAYFAQLVERGGWAVEVRPDAGGGRGKGLFATQDLEEGDVIFTEAPVIAARLLPGGDAAGAFADRPRLEALASGAERLPHTERFPLPPLVACPGGCSDEAYCSAAHADETNDIFHVAAQAMAKTLLRARRLLSDAPQRDPERCWEALRAAWLPFAVAWKAPWWECVARPDDVSAAEEGAFRAELRGLAADSLELLRAALFDTRFPALFELELFGAIIGIFELNNLDIIVNSPVEEYLLFVHEEHEGVMSDDAAATAQRLTRPLLDALGDAYDAQAQGTGFFALQSCANHDCAPSAHAVKPPGSADGAAVISAARRIRAGDEITLCYVDGDAPLAERHAALRDYGFVCACERCCREAAAA
ncbi:hypothetical protein WJX81_002351 [Elliptochloris bilobata]|uniref:SET domain-containing protein n=1 Tax=Elliptochloris bilobata TaxID=381761 RepID=A0AAW1RN28_9CHLO